MSALSNAKKRRGVTNPPTIGLTPNVIPEASGSDTGVSVRNVHPPTPPEHGEEKKWFVLRITYHREQKAKDFLDDNGIENYLPLTHTLRTINGRQRRLTRPLLPNILFAYAAPDQIDRLLKTPSTPSYITYYYDHFHLGNDGKNPPLTIRHDEMTNFMRLTSLDNEHIKLVRPEQCHWRSGDLVRITDGNFKGICGRVARVSGQQRVVVELHGVCLVTTAYVPSAFIEKM